MKLSFYAVAFIMLSYILSGCKNPENRWVIKYVPINKVERDCMVSLQKEFIGNNITHLDVKDKDISKIITAANEAAQRTCCEPIFFEMAWSGAEWYTTGRTKAISNNAYAEIIKPSTPNQKEIEK